MKATFKCAECGNFTEVELIFDEDNRLVNTKPVLVCICGSNTFRIAVDVTKWFGVVGSTGT